MTCSTSWRNSTTSGSIPLAIETLRGEDPIAIPRGKILRPLGPKSEPFLIPLLHDSNPATISTTIDLLRDLGTSASVPALQSLATGGEIRYRRAAKNAVERIQSRGK